MKTFETEKHNIPEGATHYQDETDIDQFAWIKGADSGEFMVKMIHNDSWIHDKRSFYLGSIKPIPKTKEVEWVNGDECLYMNSSEVHKFIGIDPARNDFCYIKANCSAINWVEIAKLSKPETPQQREERERLEAAYDLYILRCHAVNHPITYEFYEFKSNPEAVDGWLAVVDKTSYRKDS